MPDVKDCWIEKAGFAVYQCKDGKACQYDVGIRWQDSNSGAVGPCGQQHCWYGCFVCRFNRQQTCTDAFEEN